MAFLSNCSNIFFPMQADIYYAINQQDDYGKIKKKWIMDRTEYCTFYSLSDKSNLDNFAYDPSQFYKLEIMLFGRSKTDLRRGSDGLYRPVSQILITNIRGGACNDDESFYIETNGVYEGKPTIFEIKTIQPFVGPFNTAEYYKIQLERQDIQELNHIDHC